MEIFGGTYTTENILSNQKNDMGGWMTDVTLNDIMGECLWGGKMMLCLSTILFYISILYIILVQNRHSWKPICIENMLFYIHTRCI